jgi:competence protein ComEA
MFKPFLLAAALLFSAASMAAVDVNKASEAELDGIRGIGPGTSKLIITERKKGEFKDWSDFIARVKGVGENRAAKLSTEGLTVSGAAFKPVAAKPAAAAASAKK